MERVIETKHFNTPLQPKAVRAAAYARVSSGKDAMLHSLSAQISHYSEMIQKHPGWIYVGVYSDEARTGTREDRPGFQRLLQDCKAGKIDLVIVKSISRFARNTGHASGNGEEASPKREWTCSSRSRASIQ